MLATATIIAGIGLAASAAGTAVSYIGSQQAAGAQAQMETLRKQQMALDAERQRRDILRRTMLARAQGVNAAAGQGVSQGDSSVIGGGAQSLATGDASTLGVNQNAEIGTKYGNAYAAYDSARGTMGMGSAIGSWGSGLVANSGTISRVGATYGLWGGKSTNDPGGWGRAFGGAI